MGEAQVPPFLERSPPCTPCQPLSFRFPASPAPAGHGASWGARRPASQHFVQSDLNAAVALLLRGEIEDAISTSRPHLPRDPRAVDLRLDDGVPSLPAAALFSS